MNAMNPIIKPLIVIITYQMHISSHPKHGYPMRLTLKDIATIIIYFQQKKVYGMSKLNIGHFLYI